MASGKLNTFEHDKFQTLGAISADIVSMNAEILSQDQDTPNAANRSKIIAILCFINYIANSAYSSIAPFYPEEAITKGVPSEYIGFIFSGYSLSMCLFSPVFGIMLTKLGRKNVLIIGCLCESYAMISFGFFYYIENPVAYAVLSFLCRFIEGFGNGCLNSATSSIIAHDYEDNMGNLMGLTQTFTGLGMLSGPILGSLLF